MRTNRCRVRRAELCAHAQAALAFPHRQLRARSHFSHGGSPVSVCAGVVSLRTCSRSPSPPPPMTSGTSCDGSRSPSTPGFRSLPACSANWRAGKQDYGRLYQLKLSPVAELRDGLAQVGRSFRKWSNSTISPPKCGSRGRPRSDRPECQFGGSAATSRARGGRSERTRRASTETDGIAAQSCYGRTRSHQPRARWRAFAGSSCRRS